MEKLHKGFQGLIPGRSHLGRSPAASRLGQQVFIPVWNQASFLDEGVVAGR